MNTWIYIAGTLACLTVAGLILRRLARLRTSGRGIVGNDTEILSTRHHGPSGTIHGPSSATDTTKIVKMKRKPKP